MTATPETGIPGIVDYLADVGRCVLSDLGFEVTEPADVKVDIGTDEDPGHARITLTWPLPPEVRARLDEER